ncbi:MAG: hypothetical protein QOE14_2912 [Humisphaera sp.]|nr:hypothetical protein [Humisphaera sp.]
MSIEFSPAFDRATSDSRVARTTSSRRIAANRRNAQRSTGPRTVAGKRRASRNAIKHGLCSAHACLPGECSATYATALRELEEELQPRTTLQRSLVPHIANLIWRIDRLPQAQAKLFEEELQKCAEGEEISAADVLARRFSDDPTRNGFLLMGRYERGLHNQLLRLLRQYDQSKKNRATHPWPVDEPPVPNEAKQPAITNEARERQQEAFARREAALDRGEPPANDHEAKMDAAIQFAREHRKRTQSKPVENRVISPETAKSTAADASPVTKRTQCENPGALSS